MRWRGRRCSLMSTASALMIVNGSCQSQGTRRTERGIRCATGLRSSVADGNGCGTRVLAIASCDASGGSPSTPTSSTRLSRRVSPRPCVDGQGRPAWGASTRCGQDDPVGRAGAAVVVGDDEQRAAVVAAEHAREAAAVDIDGVQHLATFGDTGAPLTGNAGVPDRPLGVGADAVGSRPRSEVGPHPPVDQLTRVGDRPRRQPVGVRLRDHERVVAEHDHPVREPHVVGHLAAAAVGQHDGHDARLAGPPTVPRPACPPRRGRRHRRRSR